MTTGETIVRAGELAPLRARRPDVRLLDVRTETEFAGAHIEGAYNVPLHRLEAHAEALRAVAAPVVVVCRSGARARAAAGVLHRAGVRDVRLLEGGMMRLRGSAIAVRRGRPTPARLLRLLAGLAAIAAGILVARENPIVTFVAVFVGLRLLLGQRVVPCALAGGCAIPEDRVAATVSALVAGEPPAPPPGTPAPAGA
jgi:rhodanese-related sulfurtransferase